MARYDGLRKAVRNEQIKKYALEHTDLSYKEIGQAFNLTASRVWRIINGKQKKKA